MRSDEGQVNRPPMLNRLSRPTKPAAAAAGVTPNISWIIGDAWPRTPMPAVTLRRRTTRAARTGRRRWSTLAVARHRAGVASTGGVAGRSPARRGTRT